MTIPNALSKKPGSTSSKPGPRVVKERWTFSRQRPDTTWASCCGGTVGLIISVFVCVAVVLFQQYRYPLSIYNDYHPGDQILASQVADNYDSVICQRYTVSAWSLQRANIYLTYGPAHISQYQGEAVVIQDPGLHYKEEYDYRAFYLLPGSVIEASACMSVFNPLPRVHAEILFIKGTDHFNQWSEDASCSGCVEHKAPIGPDELCEAMNAMLARYVINDADTYYIVITRQHRATDNAAFSAQVTMKVIKTVYDVSNVKQKCLNADSCMLNLTFNSHDDVIVEFPFPENSLSLTESANAFSTDCELRKRFFIAVFAVLPSGLIVIACALACLCSKRQESQAKKQQLKKKKDNAKARVAGHNANTRAAVPPV